MPAKRRKASKSAATKSAELAFAVPQVIAHRVARMALASPSPSERDRREFSRMFSEKQVAFSQAWVTMATEAFRAHQSIAMSLWSSFMFPRPMTQASTVAIAKQVRNATNSIMSKGISPIHRTAVANAKRLGKVKVR